METSHDPRCREGERECGLRAFFAFYSDDLVVVYSCSCHMRNIYDRLSEGGKKVYMEDLMEEGGPKEAFPIVVSIPRENLPDAERRFLSG